MKKVKNIVKKYLPNGVVEFIKKMMEKRQEYLVYRYDKNRFTKNRLHDLAAATQDQIEGKIIFHAHSIEKGLSHDDIRLGFGKSALTGLNDALCTYLKKGYDRENLIYINALSTIRAYIDLHEAKEYDISYVNTIFSKNIMNEVLRCNDRSGGATSISAKSKVDNKTKNYKQLFTGRSSVRTYDDSAVDLNKIRDAIAISMKAPSVCNRQSGRVQVLTNKKMIGDVLSLQGGVTGYALPPVLLVVTTDTSKFLAATERNQIYTDGGLFAMSLLLSLEYEGLAACPLNAMLSVSREKKIRRVIDLPDNENIIMFISVGNFKKKNNIPKSFRLKQNNITREL